MKAKFISHPDFSNLDEMVARWFSESEQKAFLASPTKETFLRIWTRKEAYVKAKGGVIADAAKTELVTPEFKLKDKYDGFGFKTEKFDGYILSAAEYK